MAVTAFLTLQEQKALSQFKQEVTTICGPKGFEMRIFGSRARQEGDEESDLDILVLLSEYTEPKKVQIWDAAYKIFSETDILISPSVLSTQKFEGLKKRERLIAQDIEKEGILV